MSLPEVGHKCTCCANFDGKRLTYLKQPCIYQRRIAVDRFCTDFVSTEQRQQK